MYKQLAKLDESEKTVLRKIYATKKKTIDFVFNIGSNVLREAFLDFVKKAEIPEEAYSAHIRVPNFVLPDWLDFQEILGDPGAGYWLGHAIIIWFERQTDERLKINVEVGPIQQEKRYLLLSSLESQGVSFRQDAKMEGKKYTKIHTGVTTLVDWSSKQEVVKGMFELYND